MALALGLLLIGGLRLACSQSASPQPVPAAIAVQLPTAVQGTHLGYFGTFSALPPPTGDIVAWSPPADEVGCGPYAVPLLHRPLVSVVRRGTCTFIDKTLRAQEAGAVGVAIVSDDDSVILMDGGNDTSMLASVNIFAVSITRSLGDAIINWSSTHIVTQPDAAVLSLQVYSVSYLDASEACLVVLATSLVVAGAFFSTSDMRPGSTLAPHHDEVLEIDNTIAVSFCVMGSCMLLLLFYLMRYMIYFIIFAFCTGGASCLVQIGSSLIQYLRPSLKFRVIELPLLGPVACSELMASVPSGLLVILFLTYRNDRIGWIFQDLIGAGFLCMMQRTLRLPNIQVATLLLSVMFFFDIFWVFISPFLMPSGKSVMVEVARGGGTGESVPMLLRIPPIGDPLGSDRMLGFGDIALPGLLVSYLLRHDILSRRRMFNGYFVPSVIGYFCGLIVTIAALFVMRMGQPALLYLVPATLGTTLVLGWKRGEIPSLWNGTPGGRDSDGEDQELDSLGEDENTDS